MAKRAIKEAERGGKVKCMSTVSKLKCHIKEVAKRDKKENLMSLVRREKSHTGLSPR